MSDECKDYGQQSIVYKGLQEFYIQFWKSETGQAHGLQIKLLCKIKDDLNSILI